MERPPFVADMLLLIELRLTIADLERFWRRVEILGPDDCWPWTGALNSDGYGNFSVGSRRTNRQFRAHRLAFLLSGGAFDARRRFACHTCEDRYPRSEPRSRRCCNPAHLYAGTPRENSADRSRAGHHPHGITHHAAELNENDVRHIRSAWADGEEINAMARQYGLSPTAIWLIVHRKNWAHVV